MPQSAIDRYLAGYCERDSFAGEELLRLQGEVPNEQLGIGNLGFFLLPGVFGKALGMLLADPSISAEDLLFESFLADVVFSVGEEVTMPPSTEGWYSTVNGIAELDPYEAKFALVIITRRLRQGPSVFRLRGRWFIFLGLLYAVAVSDGQRSTADRVFQRAVQAILTGGLHRDVAPEPPSERERVP